MTVLCGGVRTGEGAEAGRLLTVTAGNGQSRAPARALQPRPACSPRPTGLTDSIKLQEGGGSGLWMNPNTHPQGMRCSGNKCVNKRVNPDRNPQQASGAEVGRGGPCPLRGGGGLLSRSVAGGPSNHVSASF